MKSMFRSSKKRPLSIRSASNKGRNEEEEEEEGVNTSIVVEKRQKQESRTTVKLNSVSGSSGLGFGGAAPADAEEDQEQNNARYDAANLLKLKAEQAQSVPLQEAEHLADTNAVISDEENTTEKEEEEAKTTEKQNSVNTEGLANKDKPATSSSSERPEQRTQEKSKKRVGLSETSLNVVRADRSVAKLRAAINATIAMVRMQYESFERSQARRTLEMTQTERELERHTKALSSSGEGVEYYQNLRYALAAWTGALRDLKLKVLPIQDAMHALEADIAANQRWVDWENDLVSVLHEHDVLERVIGRQPPPIIYEKTATVDEFGRDVKSKYALEREMRRQKRQNICDNRRTVDVQGDESDASVDNQKRCDGMIDAQECERFRERHMALQKALQVASNAIDVKYTKLQDLVDLFEEWSGRFPEDYASCFASHSLSDMISVFVMAEMCSLNDPWNESGGYNEAKWTAIVHKALEKKIIGYDSVDRIIEKAVLPAIHDLFRRSACNLVSSRQMKSMGAFITHVQKLLPSESCLLREMRRRYTEYAERRLNEVAIPILKIEMIPGLVASDESLKCEIRGSTFGQLRRLKKMMQNLLMYWAPVLQEEPAFVELVLNFLSDKVLYLISSLRKIPQSGLAETPDDTFAQIWKHLRRFEWLDQPEFILVGAPVRAAATAYNLT